MSADLEAARAAKVVLTERLRSEPGVTGVGIARLGSDGFCVRVLLRQTSSQLTLPTDVDGVPVHSEVVGRIRTLDADAEEPGADTPGISSSAC